MEYTFFDFIGNIGVVLIIASYLLLLKDIMKSSELSYSVMNAAGAFLIIVSLIADFNYSAFIVELFWLGISLYGIYKARSVN